MTEDTELNAFKSQIDLRQYAASEGYAWDRRDSWRGSAVMRHGADKVVIKKNTNGHHVYFSVRDDGDNGTIIDFVQRRDRLSLGEVRKKLRSWLGRPVSALPLFPALNPTSKDRVQVESEYRRMQEAPNHPYLEQERVLPARVLSSLRFSGRIRIDRFGNAVFPHFDELGLCGYELKNRGFTGFATGGQKALWLSCVQAGDACLVFAESAIDALSHAVLFPNEKARYASIGGKPNPKQPELITAAIGKMPVDSEIVAAMDADKDGRSLVEVVRLAFDRAARKDLVFRTHLPESEGDDWNQVLQKSSPPLLPIAQL